MDARLIVVFLLLPFVAIFVYATWSEYSRFKREGRAEYGLTYDPETNTTHIGAIAEDEESYDPEDYTPGDGDGEDTAHVKPDPADPNEQDSRT
ncbi:hypothetical protein RA2_00423 [Roseovarius sp. A-2]|uniref:hypothetical protein n=1 Tax=Roseovarius sp. A-2 TaxID=1570360 RepID=UPI0009C59438|nr:hypothetical protein [Roseovarius sp. A-2]GAW33387.1 hypothetical protein RA2_00423 [Roseovarius sp. A-2]